MERFQLTKQIVVGRILEHVGKKRDNKYQIVING